MRTLITEENQGADRLDRTTPGTDIKFEFADPRAGNAIGSEITLQTNVIKLDAVDKLPDYGEQAQSAKMGAVDISSLLADSNKDYYREMAEYLVRQNFFWPLRFWLKNVGGLGARDVYIDIRIMSDDAQLLAQRFKDNVPPRESGFRFYGGTWSTEISETPEQFGNQWATKLEISALQPQREVSPPPTLLLGANKSGLVTVTARIYADTLSEPLTRILRIKWSVSETQKSAKEFLEEAGVKIKLPKLAEIKRTAGDP